jgi:predicted permease
LRSIRSVRRLGLHALWLDVRYGARSLVAGRRFTVVALLTIGLTVGGIATVFTVVNAVLLRPLPYPHAGRLLWINTADHRGFPAGLPGAMALGERLTTVDAWAAYTLGYGNTIDPNSDNPVDVQDMLVTPSVFPMFGIDVVLGRPILESDTEPNSPDVVVISRDLWLSRFGGRPDVIGQTLQALGKLNGRTIAGVAAAGADVPTNFRTTPIVWSPIRKPYARRSTLIVARLAPGSTIEAAQAELEAAGSRVAAADPEAWGDVRVVAGSLLDRVAGDTKPVLWIFFAAVSGVLLIGVANLVSLQAVRNAARERELCLRAALGASRWRLVRQLLAETLMLGVSGGALGLLAALLGVRALVTTLPPRFPRADAVAVDPAVVLFAVGISLAVALVFGLLPGWRSSRPHLASIFSEGTRSSALGVRRGRLQRLMIVTETALALVLLVSAGLLVNSVGRLMTEPAGMNEDRLWIAQISLPPRYDEDMIEAFWPAVLGEIRALPQVETATIGVNTGGPLSGGDITTSGIRPEGVPEGGRDRPSFSYRLVGDRYFETLGIPLVQGRGIRDSDRPETGRVVVVNELAAAALWPGSPALGKRLIFGDQPATVVGIIPTFTITSIEREPTPQVYVPRWTERGYGTASILFRARSEAGNLTDPVTAIAKNRESEAFVKVRTMTGVRWQQLSMERFRAVVLLVFAGTALFLAIVGIFGIVSHGVVQRTREVGLRVALGATRAQVVALLLREALVPCAVGLIAGTGGAVLASRILTAFLFGVEPNDPATFGAAIGALAVAAAAAALWPARRVNAINPMEALRHD